MFPTWLYLGDTWVILVIFVQMNIPFIWTAYPGPRSLLHGPLRGPSGPCAPAMSLKACQHVTIIYTVYILYIYILYIYSIYTVYILYIIYIYCIIIIVSECTAVAGIG